MDFYLYLIRFNLKNTMKKFKLIPILTLVFIASFLTMCSKDDKTTAPGITAAQVNTNIVAGNWSVTLYNENGTIHTSDFSGYSFVFNTGGALVATNSPTIKEGTWSSGTDSGSVKITIDFTATETTGSFESISDDWMVLTSTATKTELKHVSGDDGSIDLLTFEKI